MIFLAIMIFSAVCGHAACGAQINENDIVFFGDSTTAHMKLRGGIPEERVWTGKANTVLFRTVCEGKPIYFEDEDRAVSLADAAKERKPKVLVITLGVSGGAGFMPEEKFVAVYEKMIDTVTENSPKTKIFVQSILPLSDKSTVHYKKLSKQAVCEANEWIKGLCARKGITYIDSHSLLCGEDGYLKKVYQNDEYMHLTSAAYRVIIDNVYKTVINSETNTKTEGEKQSCRKIWVEG